MASLPKTPTTGGAHESFSGNRFSFAVLWAKPKENTIKTGEFVVHRFSTRFGNCDFTSLSQEEVLNLTPADIQERGLAIQNLKRSRAGKTVYVPRKILVRLTDYTKANKISTIEPSVVNGLTTASSKKTCG